ncbi:LytR/AlgR family response regulator transcription factor [Rubrivivax rivuli]|uniref:Response regulator transcription factor n=1 Tax=Rubrivivax rivuli TaxID=1862385 RepID=A0A437RCV1_9BURK|nr:LytTR family DNA-binding domain-containing protein [Rubrivivax rivuli]RVU44572.1 response regulator transcription factor [Rubrivivax rivuli]
MNTCLIADDEPHLARALATELQRLWPALQIVHTARNGVEAAERIAALQPDVAFLDIQMPGLTGLEVAQGIEGRTRVVFVTAYDEYAVQAFENEALDYVLKPVGTERLQRTVERVQRALAAPAEAVGIDESQRLLAALQRLMPAAQGTPPHQRLRWVRASAGDLTHQVAVEEVLFFRADDKYTCVHTATAEHLIRTPITELAQQLDPEQFVQVHRSTIVNLAFLAGTRRDETSRLFLRIKGHAHELPVSRAYVHLFKAM